MKNLQDLIGFLEHMKSLNKTKIEIDSVLKNLVEIQEKQLIIADVIPTLLCVNTVEDELEKNDIYGLSKENEGVYLVRNNEGNNRWYKKTMFKIIK